MYYCASVRVLKRDCQSVMVWLTVCEDVIVSVWRCDCQCLKTRLSAGEFHWQGWSVWKSLILACGALGMITKYSLWRRTWRCVKIWLSECKVVMGGLSVWCDSHWQCERAWLSVCESKIVKDLEYDLINLFLKYTSLSFPESFYKHYSEIRCT